MRFYFSSAVIFAKLRDFVTFAYGVIFLFAMILNLVVNRLKRNFSQAYRVLNYSYAQFECNPSLHSQII